MLPLIMNNVHNEYKHKPSNSRSYIFPILGLEIHDNKSINVGHVMFGSKDFLINEVIGNKEQLILRYINTEMCNTKTFAIINLEQYGDVEGICRDGNNSLALQIVKQAIRALYISIYKNKKCMPGYEKRIIISHNIAEEKTKTIEFGRYAKERLNRRGIKKPETFDFLRFTHYCSKSRNGNFKLKWKTASKKLHAKVNDFNKWIKENRNLPLGLIWKKVNLKLRGHYNYYGVSDNWNNLVKYKRQIVKSMLYWL